MTDLELARSMADAAARLLLLLRASPLLDGAALGRAADQAANAVLMAALRQHRPDDAVLCEEEVDDAARLSCRRVWVIDPLDGTREYEQRRDDWAVHVGLAVDGRPALGAVALPPLGLVLDSGGGPSPAAAPAGRRHRLVVSRSRAPAWTDPVARALDAELWPMGSAGAKAMAVVRGEAEAYLHDGGQHEWDSCAPVAVALAAGLHCSRLDGSPLVYNRADPFLPDLLVCRPELAAPLLQAVALARLT
ncbi:3'(2'),5'-bisphosphate nucleotidase CysQ [Aquabacterium sp. J223]|uniref:3'(2'),5'-bisphosphate nucleotidase CysQ n=1 Tax=Aquabacterium sp. J223 TaxID=2898431 RepID=UPI0021AD5D28|nr:3'(2'),5'-bisphosphate nucleotidase CysQ [Aquabacterium sp. J223]UUX94326.1 3'(2'),5'-bisphosphate nucleotidase CysQ [Aquabacterium sp. J223]